MKLERLICNLLAGQSAVWPRDKDSAAIGEFLEIGRYHGVLPLLDAALQDRKDRATWPEEVVVACRQATLAQTGYEVLHSAELERVLAALASAHIASLLLKGTGLAYSLYSNPALRPRADTDLLVPPEAREAARRTLVEMGYRRVGGPAGKFVGYQLELRRHDALGVAHNIDLHWRISNAQSFAWMFSFSEFAAAAVPVPALGSRALRVANVHALVLCLIHRAGNNLFVAPGSGDRLIWHYDIHLLVSTMTAGELDTFRATISDKRVCAIALDGLRQCAERFPSRQLDALIDALARSPQARSGADLLNSSRLRREWIEFRAIPIQVRIPYLAGRAFPSREYMRERYPEKITEALPVLHARRWMEGFGNRRRTR